jgi:hypothetical protein
MEFHDMDIFYGTHPFKNVGASILLAAEVNKMGALSLCSFMYPCVIFPLKTAQ